MTKLELVDKLKAWHGYDHDKELVHVFADEALLDYIDDGEVTDAFEAIKKWYA